MVPFGGWNMPLEYTGIIPEHIAVRSAAGLFDVSHMGEFIVSGQQALELIQHVTCNDASRLADGQAQYSALTTEAAPSWMTSSSIGSPPTVSCSS